MITPPSVVRASLLRDAGVTLAVVVLAVAAVDDITTDRDTSFLFERAALAGCAVWFAVLAWRFVQRGRRAVGLFSFGVVIAAAAAQPFIGPGTAPSWTAYLTTVFGLAWFLMMSGLLAVDAVRLAPRHAA